MPFYLHQWVYKDATVRDMIVKPQNREDIVRVAAEAFNGRLLHFYLSFGEYDGISISEFPDNETAMACLMLVLGQGAVERIKTTPLMSQDEARGAMDRAHEVLTRN
jgi:uncharacterized protein with GYD domain